MTDSFRLSCVAACGTVCPSSSITNASQGRDQEVSRALLMLSASSRCRVCVSLKLSPRAGQRA